MVLRRKITIPKDNTRVFRIASSIEARNVGAGSGGFSRFVYLLHAFLFFAAMPMLLKEIIYTGSRENSHISVVKIICKIW